MGGRVSAWLKPSPDTRREAFDRGFAADVTFGNGGDGSARGVGAIPGLRIEIPHPMDVDLSMGTPDPGHPIPGWVECAKSQCRFFDSPLRSGTRSE